MTLPPENSISSSIITPKKLGPYVFRGTIGEGSFSVVKLVYHEEQKNYYACKIVPFSLLKEPNLIAQFEAEIRINQQLYHPSIAQIVDLLKNDKYYFIIMEFCNNGELFNFIVERQGLKEERAASFLYQILSGLQFVHNQSIAHRDLKPENLLLDHEFKIKISDFGLSKFVDRKGLCSTPCGSPCYASPECLSGQKYDGRKSDLWSVGVILYAMVTGRLPWTKRNQKQLFEQIKRGEYKIPQGISQSCQNLISGFMTVDPKQRLTIKQALKSDFFSQIDDVNYSFLRTVPFLSLKRVDIFFSRDDNEKPVIYMKRTRSAYGKDFSKTLKCISQNSKHVVRLKPRARSPSKSNQNNSQKKKSPKEKSPQKLNQNAPNETISESNTQSSIKNPSTPDIQSKKKIIKKELVKGSATPSQKKPTSKVKSSVNRPK